MPQHPLENLIEAALFFKGGAVSLSELAKMIGTSKEEVAAAAGALSASLEQRGVRLVREGDMLALATAPEANALVEKIQKEELEGPLGKAGLETLSVIVYRGPIAKSGIDYIRGVNCSSILRSLMVRGLIERVENPDDKRSFLYRATVDLPAYLGVSSVSELPGYAETRAEIERVFAERDTALLAQTGVDAENQ